MIIDRWAFHSKARKVPKPYIDIILHFSQMRSDHLRSTERGIRQVSRVRQTSEATAEADAEPQIQIGAGRY